MAGLPTPGGNANNWGSMLNDYLQQALAADGTLVTAATNPYTTNPNTNLAGSSKPGIVQLSNDLGGSAASPSVVALQGNPVSTVSPSDGNVLTWNAGVSKWLPIAPSGQGWGLSGDVDGGSATSSYGGLTPIDGGDST